MNPLAASYADVFAAKLDSSGNLMWNTFLGGSEYDESTSIAIDEGVGVIASGNSFGTWGNPAQAYNTHLDTFIAKLDLSGNLVWNTFLGGSEDER